MSVTVTKQAVRREISSDVELSVTDQPDITRDDPGNRNKRKEPISPETMTIRYLSRDAGTSWHVNVLVYGESGHILLRGFAQYQGWFDRLAMPDWLSAIVDEHKPAAEPS